MSESSGAAGTAGEDSLASWSAAEDGDELAEGPSGGLAAGDALGGADAVPETPDNVPADQDLGIRESGLGSIVTEDGSRGSSASEAAD